MINSILKLYWMPNGTPLWRHHLPSLLIGTFLLGIWIVLDLTIVKSLLPMFVVLVITEIVFAVWAKARFGNQNPRDKQQGK
ncbi:MAG: hypothetical protein HAW67_05215 [Endozoicomonadaceae bacterium]|nr:hypothetical protein [Endozoicomonadaceae bacterium]